MNDFKNVIKNQIVAGTIIDAHGEKATKEFLEKLAEDANARGRNPTNIQHDFSSECHAYSENYRVVPSLTHDGEWNLVADFYYDDEIDIGGALKGFSYSATITTHGAIENSAIDIYLPYPAYKDTELMQELLTDKNGTSFENIAIGEWRKKEATLSTLGLFVSKYGVELGIAVAGIILSPIYSDLYNSRIKPILSNLIIKIKKRGDIEKIDFVQIVSGNHNEVISVYFKVSENSVEEDCYLCEKIVDGLATVNNFLINNSDARKKPVHIVVLNYLADVRSYYLAKIEFRDGQVITYKRL